MGYQGSFLFTGNVDLYTEQFLQALDVVVRVPCVFSKLMTCRLVYSGPPGRITPCDLSNLEPEYPLRLNAAGCAHRQRRGPTAVNYTRQAAILILTHCSHLLLLIHRDKVRHPYLPFSWICSSSLLMHLQYIRSFSAATFGVVWDSKEDTGVPIEALSLLFELTMSRPQLYCMTLCRLSVEDSKGTLKRSFSWPM